jgi:predicted nucleotidyltransferase
MAEKRRLDVTSLIIAPDDRRALLKFLEFLYETIGERIVAVSLFGSKARGDSGPDSDIDVLVILTEDDRALRRAIQTQAARISLEFDLILSPRVIGAPRWEQMRGFTLHRNVVRDAAGLDIEDGELVIEPAGIS